MQDIFITELLEMHRIFLSLGGNLGDREEYLALTREQIKLQIGEIVSHSDIYESEPWGFSHNKAFLNQVIEVESSLSALCLLDICNKIENQLGRNRLKSVGEYEARTVDIDILFFDSCIYTLPPLIVPHRHLHERMFVMEPLAQIAPQLIHPLLCQTIEELKGLCQDQGKVWKFNRSVQHVEA